MLYFAAKSRSADEAKKPPTQNAAASSQMERDEADYAVVRPTDVAADDDDISNEYSYPTSSAPAGDSTGGYLCLLPDPEEPLRLLAVFTKPETADDITFVSGADDDVRTEDDEMRPDDVIASAANEHQSSVYIDVF